MQNSIESIKLLIPIVTFFLGILATPVVEYIKEKSKAKSVRKNLYMELEDELKELPERLAKMSEMLKSWKAIQANSTKNITISKYVPRNISCYFLKPSIDASFRHFNKSQRFALKALLVQLDALDGCRKIISEFDIKDVKNINDKSVHEIIKYCKNYLYTGSCTLNTLRLILDVKEKIHLITMSK